MTSSERYEKAWNDYLAFLQQCPTAKFRTYLKRQHIYGRGIEKWMHKHGLRVGDAKERIRALQSEAWNSKHLPTSADTGAMFLPVEPGGSPGELLSGVSLTFPDGTLVSIRRGSPSAIVEFLTLYMGKEVGACSD